MGFDHAAQYAAIRARDARFDGSFYTGVKTTGIYCRPICPAKTPLARNCLFFETAAAAEAAGFRPCLRCRPELSPACNDTRGSLARQFMQQVQLDGLFGENVESAAARLGVSSRHLRRTLEEECGVSPLDLVQTTRLLFARRLLSSTSLPVSRVAFGAGFGSLARFNHTFRAHYGTAPGAFRRQTLKRSSAGPGIRLALAYREPFAWSALLDYWSKRAIPGVEVVRDGRYWRTVRIGDRTGWFSAGPARAGALDIEIGGDLATHLLPIAGKIRAMFDLDANPAPIATALAGDPVLASLIRATPGLRVPGAFDSFELAVRAVLGQQVSVAAASTLAGRLVERFAARAPGLPDGLTHFPLSPAVLAGAVSRAIAAIGLPAARAGTIHRLAQAVASGDLDFTKPAAAFEALGKISGVGDWTREYIALRVLRWPDAFPSGDLGLRKALGECETLSARALESRSQGWRPWRAYAAMHLWTAASKEKP